MSTVLNVLAALVLFAAAAFVVYVLVDVVTDVLNNR